MPTYKDFENYQPEQMKVALEQLDSLGPNLGMLRNIYRSIEKAYKIKTDPEYVKHLEQQEEKSKAFMLGYYTTKALKRTKR